MDKEYMKKRNKGNGYAGQTLTICKCNWVLQQKIGKLSKIYWQQLVNLQIQSKSSCPEVFFKKRCS